jgi:antitoxin component YwqK of YwqJK toxin-antitoxin module
MLAINGEMVTRKFLHPNGRLHKECSYIDGKKNGPYKRWYYDGQLETEYTLVDGKKDGLYVLWYPNGQLAADEFYNCGKLVCGVAYDMDGEVIKETRSRAKGTKI